MKKIIFVISTGENQMRAAILGAATLMAAGLTSAAWAADKDEDTPLEPGTLAIRVPAELQNDRTTRTKPADGERFNLSTKIEPELTFQATREVSFLLGVTLEQIRAPDRGRDEAFENEALYVKTLTANYETGPFALYAGKFTPNFGRAWDIAPGIYGDRFAKDYEFAERWGAGGSVAFDGTPLGDMTFSASTFLVDRTALSDSWITRRGRTTESDGGPGNTDSPRSFALALDGANLPALDGFDYHLGYTQQAKGEDDTGTMRGIVAGAQFATPLIGALAMTPLLEWAAFDNFGGIRGADRTVWTAAVQFDYGPWQLVTAYAKRAISGPDGLSENDRSLQISGGYSFPNGLLAELGWWRVEEAGERADIVGMRLTYEFGTQYRLY
jgi:hypothetical protein